MKQLLRLPARYYSTAMSAPVSSPFTRTVVDCVRGLYPEKYADKSFDNTGLLLEAPLNPTQPHQRNSALLTVDLTTAVASEAIRRRDSVVIAYHPIIFRPLRSITLNDTQQTSLLRLAQAGISVYSPHTAIDAAPGGMGDWLCDVVTGCYISKPLPLPSGSGHEHEHAQGVPQLYTQPTYPYPQGLATEKMPPQIEHTRSTIHPSPAAGQEGSEAGMGRLVTFSTSQPLRTLIDHIAAGTGTPGGIPVATPQQHGTIDDISIRTVGVCPGSGSGVLLKGVDQIPDLLLTGEMSHHETLAAIEQGSVVVSLFHSNTERGFLHAVMKKALEDRVRREWNARSRAVGDEDDSEAVVEISEADRDPYGVMIRRF